ncbi:MAG TPA: hypothetical protein ENJ39_01400 [Flammeovirgaceae bacterium]|nr:hypothetical protein [Flammeovirgaceae bacterium]
MITWITIVFLILLGLALLVVELIFIPGTTVVGILGFLFVIGGLILTFQNYGSSVGWAVTGGTALFSAGVFVYAFRSGAWSRFSLKGSISSKVNEDKSIDLQPGDEGIARSALRPIGKGEFAGREYEVRSLGNLVKAGTRIAVLKVDNKNRTIFVEPLND